MKKPLQFAEEKFRAIFENASLGILMIDEDGAIVLANHFLLKLFGYDAPEELIGQQLEVLIPKRFRKEHTHYRRSYRSHPETRPMGMGRDLFGLTKDGRELPLEISLSSYQNDEQVFSIAFISDISARLSVQEKLREQRLELAAVNKRMEALNEELEQKVRERTESLQYALQELEASKNEVSMALDKEKDLGEMKSAFVSMASHEFRTPLSTILSSVSLLAKYKHTDEQEKRDKHIHRIKSSVLNLNNILNEFLSLGKIEEGKIRANFSEFDVKKLIEDQHTEMSEIFRPGQQIDFIHEGETRVRLDQNLFKNIMINLLSNAAKFSPEHTIIKIRTKVTDDAFTCTVKDEGMGISEKDQQQLFSIFFRGQNATNISGTGLGLHIVKKYTHMMKGQLSLKSALGAGTEINLKFAR